MNGYLPNAKTIFRNIAVTFVVLTVLLAGFIGYVALSRAVITVALQPVNREVSFQLPIGEAAFGKDQPADVMHATFLETTEQISVDVQPTGSGTASGKAGGIVTIHNDTDRDQSLVATTRLLSPQQVLFRLKVAVRVPARGNTTVAVEADQSGPSSVIPATRFTIPGLTTALQQHIYATTNQSMTIGGASAKTVTDQDQQTARATVQQKAVDQAQTTFSAQVGAGKFASQDFIVQSIQETSSTKVGASVPSFTLTQKIKVVGVVFDRTELLRRIGAQLGASASSTSPSQVTYAIGSYDPVARTATISGQATVGTALSSQSSIFSSENFTGSTPDEVRSFLKSYAGISDVQVKLSPYWQSHLPRLPGRIQVVVKQ